MTTELEEIKRNIQIQKKIFDRNINHLIGKLKDLENLRISIGEVSQYDALQIVQIELNEAIEKMLRR